MNFAFSLLAIDQIMSAIWSFNAEQNRQQSTRYYRKSGKKKPTVGRKSKREISAKKEMDD